MADDSPLIPAHGGYRRLKSYQVAKLVYDVTVRFCDRYVSKRSRTHDQMVQAARSGVQNIAEGSQNSGTSKKSELKLTGVARGSLEELNLDFEHFLDHRGLPVWERDDARRQALIDLRPRTVVDFARWVESVRKSESSGSTSSTGSTPSTYAEIAANGAIALITVASFLLDRQLAAQGRSFEVSGGFTERLYARRASRRAGAPTTSDRPF